MESTADIALGDAVPHRQAISIEITSTPVLSYALAHNRIPVVSRLALTADAPVRGATVRLGVRDAEGPIARSIELLADMDEGRTTVLTDVGLVMDPAAMLHVEEQRPGVIDVEVEVDGEIVGETSRSVQVLAANQWLATPLPLALEMLAAHVMPNHPAVTALVSEAADLLEQKTGSGALVGYAATPERVDDVVRAITDVLQGRGIRYSEPPASWSDLGQQVRSPGDVLTWRVGTPLDPVVVLAAAPEPGGPGAAGPAAAALARRGPRLPRLLAGGAQRGERRDDGRHATGEPRRPRAHRAGRDHAAHEHGRGRRRPAPPRLRRLAHRRARPDRRRHRRPPRPPRRHHPATGESPRRDRRPADRRVPARRAQRPGAAGGHRRPLEPARGPAAGAAVEERAAGPEPAQPADQLHRALRAAPHPARHRAVGPGQLRPRRDADHPVAR